jgi:hypothetical protein
MLFEVAPEVSARRVAEALVAAETGDPDAWSILDENNLYRLRTDAESLAALVPCALLCLSEQLIHHPRASVRLDAIRMLSLVYWQDPNRVVDALGQLMNDVSRGVARAAENLRQRLLQ